MTMVEEKSRGERFGKDVGSHVRRGEPQCRKGTCSNMVADKVMPNIDMFCPRRDSIGCCNDTGTLIVTEDGKGMWSRKFIESKEKF